MKKYLTFPSLVFMKVIRNVVPEQRLAIYEELKQVCNALDG